MYGRRDYFGDGEIRIALKISSSFVKTMAEKTEISEVVFDKCPVCKKGKVKNINTKKFFGLVDSSQIKCDNCSAIFIEKEEKEGEKTFELDLSESKEEHKYNGQVLKVGEWKRGLSDLDFCIANNKLPNLTVVGLKILLEEGERTHWYSSAVMMEERAVRQVQSYGIRGRGFYSGTSTGESHGELRRIDKGSLLLTNKRIVFNGNFKHLEYPLNKLTSLEEFKDAIEVGVSNRQKLQTYLVDEPSKWATYIKIAINNMKSKGNSKNKATLEISAVSNEPNNLKHEIKQTKESLAKIREQLVKLQEKKKNGRK